MIERRAFIIHLKRASSRHPQVAALLDALGPGAEIQPAVDGAALTAVELEERRGSSGRPRYPFPLRPAEVAAFLSHRACWQRIVDEGIDAALVVEDDVVIGPGFEAALDLARRHLADGMLIRFPAKVREHAGATTGTAGPVRLFRPRVVGLGMQMQLVTRGAARQLVEVTETFDRPVDTLVQARWAHGVDVLTVLPSGISEVSAAIGGSLISEPMPLATWLRHETLRPVYRAAVRFRSLLSP